MLGLLTATGGTPTMVQFPVGSHTFSEVSYIWVTIKVEDETTASATAYLYNADTDRLNNLPYLNMLNFSNLTASVNSHTYIQDVMTEIRAELLTQYNIETIPA